MRVFGYCKLGGLLLLIFNLVDNGFGSSTQQPSIWNTNPPLEVITKNDKDGNVYVRYFRTRPINGGLQAFVYAGYQQVLRPPYLLTPIAVRAIWKNPKKGVIDKTVYELLLQKSLTTNDKVLSILDTYEDDNYIYSISELADEKDLYEVLLKRNRPFPESLANHYFGQVVSGVAYLHREKIIHRDLKLENVVAWSDGIVKITDFGFAIQLDNEKNDELIKDTFESIDVENGIVIGKSYMGSPYYISPEICSSTITYSYKSDVYAMGVMLFIMFTGSMPDDDPKSHLPNQPPDCTRAVSPIYLDKVLRKAKVSDEGRELVKNMMMGDVASRFTLDQVISSNWLTEKAGSRVVSERPITPHSNKENVEVDNRTSVKRDIPKELKKDLEVQSNVSKVPKLDDDLVEIDLLS